MLFLSLWPILCPFGTVRWASPEFVFQRFRDIAVPQTYAAGVRDTACSFAICLYKDGLLMISALLTKSMELVDHLLLGRRWSARNLALVLMLIGICCHWMI